MCDKEFAEKILCPDEITGREALHKLLDRILDDPDPEHSALHGCLRSCEKSYFVELKVTVKEKTDCCHD